MNKLSFASLIIMCAIAFNADSHTLSDENNKLAELFSQLKVEQGSADFTQKKHFSFLSTPMSSKGKIKVHQGNIIWQVESPVFSKQIIMGNDIWQLEEKGSSRYQKVASHSSVENLVKAIFSGDIDQSQWEINLLESQCLSFAPKDAVLAQAISQLQVCLFEENHRQVKLFDAQNNLTEIAIHFTDSELSSDDIEAFNFNR